MSARAFIRQLLSLSSCITSRRCSSFLAGVVEAQHHHTTAEANCTPAATRKMPNHEPVVRLSRAQRYSQAKPQSDTEADDLHLFCIFYVQFGRAHRIQRPRKGRM